MAKKEDVQTEEVSDVAVRMLCVYCGEHETANPGDVIHVDPEEADRLIGLKAAVPHVEAAIDASDDNA